LSIGALLKIARNYVKLDIIRILYLLLITKNIIICDSNQCLRQHLLSSNNFMVTKLMTRHFDMNTKYDFSNNQCIKCEITKVKQRLVLHLLNHFQWLLRPYAFKSINKLQTLIILLIFMPYINSSNSLVILSSKLSQNTCSQNKLILFIFKCFCWIQQ
jgi:hypothetical protein